MGNSSSSYASTADVANLNTSVGTLSSKIDNSGFATQQYVQSQLGTSTSGLQQYVQNSIQTEALWCGANGTICTTPIANQNVNMNNMYVTQNYNDTFTPNNSVSNPNNAQISNDISSLKELSIIGNKSAGGTVRNVGISDKLTVHGPAYANGFYPTATTAATPTVDTSNQYYKVSVGSSVAITPPKAQYYIVFVAETSVTGDTAIFLCANGASKLVSSITSTWVDGTKTPATGKFSVAYNGTAYAIYNNKDSNCTFGVQIFKLGVPGS